MAKQQNTFDNNQPNQQQPNTEFICQFCYLFLKDPIELPCCRAKICLSHTANFINKNYNCNICNQQGTKPKKGFVIDEQYDMYINSKVHLYPLHKNVSCKFDMLQDVLNRHNSIDYRKMVFNQIASYKKKLKSDSKKAINCSGNGQKLLDAKRKMQLLNGDLINHLLNPNRLNIDRYIEIVKKEAGDFSKIKPSRWEKYLRRPNLNKYQLAKLGVKLDNLITKISQHLDNINVVVEVELEKEFGIVNVANARFGPMNKANNANASSSSNAKNVNNAQSKSKKSTKYQLINAKDLINNQQIQ